MGYLPYQLVSRISAINSINMKNRSKNPVHSTLPDHVNRQPPAAVPRSSTWNFSSQCSNWSRKEWWITLPKWKKCFFNIFLLKLKLIQRIWFWSVFALPKFNMEPWKWWVSKRNLLFLGAIFRFHVKLFKTWICGLRFEWSKKRFLSNGGEWKMVSFKPKKKHGCFESPSTLGFWDPFQMAKIHGLYMEVILTTY